MADEKKGGGGKGKGGAPAKKGLTGKKAMYKVEGGQLVRVRQMCPKCGPGLFLGQHKDRSSCGNCGYTEFKRK